MPIILGSRTQKRENGEFISVLPDGIRVISGANESGKKTERTVFRISEPYRFTKDGVTYSGVVTDHSVQTRTIPTCAEEGTAQIAALERAADIRDLISMSTSSMHSGDTSESPFVRSRLGLPVLVDGEYSFVSVTVS